MGGLTRLASMSTTIQGGINGSTAQDVVNRYYDYALASPQEQRNYTQDYINTITNDFNQLKNLLGMPNATPGQINDAVLAVRAAAPYIPALQTYEAALATPMGFSLDPDKNVIYSDFKDSLQLLVDKGEMSQQEMGQRLLDKLNAESINPTAFTGALSRVQFEREKLDAQKMIDGEDSATSSSTLTDDSEIE